MMRRGPFLCVAGLLIVLLIGASTADAFMDSSKEFVLDFGDPKGAKEKANWNDPNRFNVTEQGFGWDGPRNAHRDLTIQSTQRVAVGWSWRPVCSVWIRAEIEPAGEFKFRGSSITWPAGQLFARYSPDGMNWSSWNHLNMEKPKDRKKPKQAYRGTLRIPYKEQKAYRKLLREYSRMDVPWGSDEEAAVKWILRKEPRFFQKSLPFVGYVQFLFEASLRGEQRIKRIRFSLSYAASGMHMPPRDKGARKRHRGPWRFRADPANRAKQSDPAGAHKPRR
jgi:hypothetical protein